MTSPHIQTGRVTDSSYAPEGDYFLLVDDPESSRCHLLLFTEAAVVGGSRAWSLESSGNKPASDVAQRAGFTHGWWVPKMRVTLNDDAHLWREDRPEIQTGTVRSLRRALLPSGDYFVLVNADSPGRRMTKVALAVDPPAENWFKIDTSAVVQWPRLKVAQDAGFRYCAWLNDDEVKLRHNALEVAAVAAATAEEESWVPKPGDRVTVVRANPAYAQVNGAQATLLEDDTHGDYLWKVEFSDEDWRRWSAQPCPETQLYPPKRLWVYEVAPPTEVEASAEPGPEVTEVERLRLELAEARGRVEAQEREHAEFRRTVGRVAMAKASEHGWCDVVRQALDEMGVEVPDDRVSATLTITVKVSGLRSDHAQRGEERWFRNSLTPHRIEAALAGGRLFDSDWDEEDKAVEVASVVASDIKVYEIAG